MSIWWTLHLRREAASVPLARRLLLGTMETAGVDPDISHDMSLALTEACANAVEHGGSTANGGTSEVYRVTAYLDGEVCRIEVTDSGPGFPVGRAERRRTVRTLSAAPAPTPALNDPATAESGRGLFLIEALTDRVHVHNRPGRGAVVSFDKVLKWQEGALLKAS